MKTYTYQGRKVHLRYTTYQSGGSLAVEMLCNDDPEFREVITVNLCSPMQDECCAFIDSNNMPGIGRWLERNHLSTDTGFRQRSGFCNYELHIFDI